MLKHKKSPYKLFYNVNSILRGWCNFYSAGNSKSIFSYIRSWIYRKIYNYLLNFYSFQPQFKRGRQRLFKKKLSSIVWSTHYKHPYYAPKSYWWCIPPEYVPVTRRKRFYIKEYFLFNPGYITVSTPSIITGMSAYHPEDREKLAEKALYWQKGLLRMLLTKSKRQCKNCQCSLVDLEEQPEIHHIYPISRQGPMRFTNLAVLCKECHSLVTTAVRQRNLEEIEIYESNRILSGVSTMINSLESKQKLDLKA